MSEKKHILVAGAGLGGLTTSLALARYGYRVTLLEKVRDLGEVGAGIQISANATKVLEKLGLASTLHDIGFKPQAATMRIGASGRRVFSNPLGDAARARYGADYYHVHRADLYAILVDEVRKQSLINLKLGAQVDGFTDTGQRVDVALAGGEAVTGEALVGADGIHSTIRAGLFEQAPPRFTGNVAWRLLVPTADLPKDLIPPEATVWTGSKGHAVTYYVRCGELVNFVGVLEREDWRVESWLERGDLAELKRDFKPWCDTIQTLLDAAPATECFKWALFDRDPMDQWSEGRVTLLGDACHPMLPFMAQGACMAIEDAWVLGQSVSEATCIEAGFATYETKRKKRTARVQLAARANAKRFHHGNIGGQLLNYAPLWVTARLAPQLLNLPFDWIYGADVTKPTE